MFWKNLKFRNIQNSEILRKFRNKNNAANVEENYYFVDMFRF